MREALDGWEEGVTLGRKKMSNLRYADDIILLAENIEDLKEVLLKIEQPSAQAGLKINIFRTQNISWVRL